MEELEKRKMVKKGKIMHCIYAEHLRALVDKSNDLGILRDEVVTILNNGENVALIYFR